MCAGVWHRSLQPMFVEMTGNGLDLLETRRSHHPRFEKTAGAGLGGIKGQRENTPVDTRPSPAPGASNSPLTASSTSLFGKASASLDGDVTPSPWAPLTIALFQMR